MGARLHGDGRGAAGRPRRWPRATSGRRCRPTRPSIPSRSSDVLADLDRVILPGITHWQSPNWFAYFPANTSGPAILGDSCRAGLGVQGMLWATSPACTELETHVLDWMVELLGLPDRFRSDGAGGGVIQDSASSATLCALLAARERAAGTPEPTSATWWPTPRPRPTPPGEGGPGRGAAADQVRLIAVDDDLRHAARRPGRRRSPRTGPPAGCRSSCCATVGTTSSLAVDPVPALAEVGRRARACWLHVDAAMAGLRGRVPRAAVGQRRARPGRQLRLQPAQVAVHQLRLHVLLGGRPGRAAGRALSILPEYLRNAASASGAVIDYRDWQVPLGRRFRALKLWFVLRHYGAEGLRHHVRAPRPPGRASWRVGRGRPPARARRAAPLDLVCFRHVDGDDATQALLDAVNASGRRTSPTPGSTTATSSGSRSARPTPRSATSGPAGITSCPWPTT